MTAPCPILGFVVVATLHVNASSDQSDAMVDDLVDTLESDGLMMAGGGDRVLEFHVMREGTQAADTDRHFLMEWAARWTDVALIAVSELVDLNHAA